MAGYWSSSFLLLFCGQHVPEVQVNEHAKVGKSSHLAETHLVNKHGHGKIFFCRRKAGHPERGRLTYLAH